MKKVGLSKRSLRFPQGVEKKEAVENIVSPTSLFIGLKSESSARSCRFFERFFFEPPSRASRVSRATRLNRTSRWRTF